MQAPVAAAQAVAPQVALAVLHAAAQQLPVPEMPQTPEVHALFDVHAPVVTLATHMVPLQ